MKRGEPSSPAMPRRNIGDTSLKRRFFGNSLDSGRFDSETLRREKERPRAEDVDLGKVGETSDDVASSVTRDGLVVFRRKFFFPKTLAVCAPEKSDRARSPPSGYITIYEMTLRAGLRFPLAPELIEIITAYGVALSQFSYRAMTIIVGLILFFREHKATLKVEHLSRMCKFICDPHGRISCRSNKKWLDLTTRYPPKNWTGAFFFVKNEWGLIEKWGKMKDLPAPTHIGDEDILKVLGVPNVESLHYELCRIGQYVTEERLFKAGLSIQEGRSQALPVRIHIRGRQASSSAEGMSFKGPPKDKSSPLKRSREAGDELVGPSHSAGCERGSKTPVLTNDVVVIDPEAITHPLKVHIPENVLKHSCLGRQQATELLNQKKELETCLETALDEWNLEFVKVKFVKGEYERRLTAKAKEIVALEDQLSGCRAELATTSTSLSLQRREVDGAREDLVEARAEIRQKRNEIKSLISEKKTLAAEKKALEVEKHRLLDLLAEKETVISRTESQAGASSLKAVDEFKKSASYHKEMQEMIQKAREEIYDVEVRDLERQCLEEGFVRGFLKGVRLVHRKTGVDIDGLSPSQASDDGAPDLEDEIESELRKVLSSDDDIDVV